MPEAAGAKSTKCKEPPRATPQFAARISTEHIFQIFTVNCVSLKIGIFVDCFLLCSFMGADAPIPQIMINAAAPMGRPRGGLITVFMFWGYYRFFPDDLMGILAYPAANGIPTWR
jgi:hypothetical protein